MTAGPASPPADACPSCGWPTRPDDNFCEACRAELRQVAVSGGRPGHATRCSSCQVSQVSSDGYCDSCGRKAPSNRDHAELDLGVLAGVTDRGLRHHGNEDAMALATAELAGGPVAAAVVCDGVSGSPRADEAARAAAWAAVDALLAGLRRGDDPAAACDEAVARAREAVAGLVRPAANRPAAAAPAGDRPAEGASVGDVTAADASAGDRPAADASAGGASDADTPAATFVGATMTGQAVTLCWLGDSRAYWLGAGPGSVAERLTRDDSVAAELVAAGGVSEAEALLLPEAHVVTRWIGADWQEGPPHVRRFDPPGPGVLLLCTDGLWNYQPDAGDLARLVLPAALTDPLGAAGTLVRFAIDAGGMDNVTAVLAPLPLSRPAVAEPGFRSGAEPRDRPAAEPRDRPAAETGDRPAAEPGEPPAAFPLEAITRRTHS